MAKVKTVISQTPEAPAAVFPGLFVVLQPREITISNIEARPGPYAPDEEKSLDLLADSLREVGQIVPLVVVPDGHGGYRLVDGKRRLQAAMLIEDFDHCDFPLLCVVSTTTRDPDALRHGVLANLKRRGYTALQFAHLCAEVRLLHAGLGWDGPDKAAKAKHTGDVADYLQVSKAQVRQHEKLLSCPDGMPPEQYERLIDLVKAGRVGADTAFYTLTHVEPIAVKEVIDEVTKKDDLNAPGGVEDAPGGQTTGEAPAIEPEGARLQQSASDEQTAKAKSTPEAAKKSNKPKAGTRTPPAARSKPPDITKSDIKSAAARLGVEKGDIKPVFRSMPELRTLFDALKSTKYPDVFRSFISLISGAWWTGAATNKEVLEQADRLVACLRKECR